jgi:chromosomal replication initiator protein
MSPRKFVLWFSTVREESVTPERVTLAVGDNFLREWIQNNYMKVVLEAVHEVYETDAPVTFVVDSVLEQDAGGVHAAPQEDVAEPATPSVAPAAANHDYFKSNSDVSLHSNYTFDSFVVGPSNQLSHAAARAVAEAPAGSYNPLFLHGDVGLGKTHLLQAICHKALQSGKPLKVRYLSSETFVNEFIAAVSRGDLDTFRYRYRNVDMLLIDDIHMLANKERTQEEFFHTFNTLYNNSKQIVLSSDSPPSEIPTLRDRLISRFEWGLVTEIAAPRYETRLAILRRKARERDVAIPEEVLSYLAENIDRNIRELEGAVTKVVGYAKLIGSEIDLDLARQALGFVGERSHGPVTGVERILDKVCKHFDVRVADLRGRRRTQSVVVPRQVAMYLLRNLTNLSLEEVGQHLGGRDHSTVLYAVGKVKDRMAADSVLAQRVRELELRLKR